MIQNINSNAVQNDKIWHYYGRIKKNMIKYIIFLLAIGGVAMPSLSHSIIVNVGESYIETYLKNLGLERAEEERGKELKYWVDKLLSEKKLSIDNFEEFLFEELFWGKRKTIRIYKISQTKNYRKPDDWEESLKDNYNIESINFCNILGMLPDGEKTRKIVAVQSEENIKGELDKIRLLFAYGIQINGEKGYVNSIAYIPVEINFKEKIMILKAWTRQNIAQEQDRADDLLTHTCNLMKIEFLVETEDFNTEHKRTLFLMSKNLIDEAYSHVPTYNQIYNIKETVEEFIEKILGNLQLRNVNVVGDKHKLEKGVMNFEGEIRNVIEGLTISDYFYRRNFDEIWNMGLEAVVARIKFNDAESVLTSLRGENTSTPIFCTKTFMSLKNRMEETEKTETLWITMKRKRGNLNLKFDASESQYLEILIKYGIRFNEADMISTLKIYDKYAKRLDKKIAEQSKSAIG